MSEDHSYQTTTELQMVQPSQNHFSNFWFKKKRKGRGGGGEFPVGSYPYDVKAIKTL